MSRRRLLFKRDGRVYWDDTHTGNIEPMLTKAGKWGYLPTHEGGPWPLSKEYFHNTQRELKQCLRRKMRMLDGTYYV